MTSYKDMTKDKLNKEAKRLTARNVELAKRLQSLDFYGDDAILIKEELHRNTCDLEEVLNLLTT